jgi:acyl transferase domain-containing protein
MSAVKRQPIAIIGMAGRFPDAPNLRAFWQNLEEGKESLVDFTDEEIIKSGVDAALIQDPNYVKRGTFLEHCDLFDAGFFGFNPREAEIMDPQHRVFLECAWEAVEDAGYAGPAHEPLTGVFAGASMNTYLLINLLQNPEVLQAVGAYQTMLGSDKDFLATRVSYKLNLRGPSVTIQTACSTSLVAVQMACQALLAKQCNMTIAGGVSLSFPQKCGYLYTEGMIFSPDARCRPFDAKGEGIRGGAGAGVVVLKRLEDAIRDRDSIHAVILGAAVNNDGAGKMGYTSPSVEGQAEVIADALQMAGVHPESIGYVEAHGTATKVGDPIEIAALERAYRAYTNKTQFCAIGSVKSNIGHLDAAAGIAGLIKAILALQHKRIPASLGFEEPNPLINFTDSPFYVNQKLKNWPSEKPRRAGVSSFGIGGTNAHIVLEEAPVVCQEETTAGWPKQLLVLSARSEDALASLTQNVTHYLAENPTVPFADVCYTLQTGRKKFPHRRMEMCETREEAIAALAPENHGRKRTEERTSRAVTFMFSGQGSQYVSMAKGLYETQPVFRENFDQCAELLKNDLGEDLRDALYGSGSSDEKIKETRLAQPALFSIEYSLARMWMAWGIMPENMIGHSIGEYVAACLADVFSLEDGLRLVAMRGKLMQQAPGGSMIAVSLPRAQLSSFLTSEISLAAVNAPALCTLSGPHTAIAALQSRLELSGIQCRSVHTSHAFHSSMMDEVAQPFLEVLDTVKLSQPRIPFISNLTGKWIRPDEATNASYWVEHSRRTVLFSDGVQEILATPDRVLLEVGPGRVLSIFARECLRGLRGCEVFSSLPHPKDPVSDMEFILQTLGGLWLSGMDVKWDRVHEGEKLHRVPLPTYPFERQRYWIEPRTSDKKTIQGPTATFHKKPLDEWFYVPSWIRSVLPSVTVSDKTHGPWLVFKDSGGVSELFKQVLTKRGDKVIEVEPGTAFGQGEDGTYAIEPSRSEDYTRLLKELQSQGHAPKTVLFLWGLPKTLIKNCYAAFHSMMALAKACGNIRDNEGFDFIVVSSELQAVHGHENIDPVQSLVAGLAKVIPAEYPNIRCRSIDLDGAGISLETAENVLLECIMPHSSSAVAYRDGYRWIQKLEPIRLPARDKDFLRKGGTYLITGGMGGIGLTIATYFAEAAQARLVLIGRSSVPERGQWMDWVTSHDENDPVSRKIEVLKRLEALGATILPLAVDVCNEGAMAEAIDIVHKKLGPVHGVIHAAGTVAPGLIELKTVSALEKVLSPKVEGTLILESLLKNDPLDFFHLASSINALNGVAGASDYTAANLFLDSFATSRFKGGRALVTAINWDTWQEVGMAMNAQKNSESREWFEHAIKPKQGTEAFRRVLAAGLPQVAVISRDLSNFGADTDKHTSMGGMDQTQPVPQDRQTMHDRPMLPNAYVEPETDSQREIAAIWSELLGVQKIGIDDNFFELGGHSLLATGVLARILNIFKISVPLVTIFESPTIRLLANHVDTLLWASATKITTEDTSDREEVEL